jgi:hypothetical protein
MSAARADTGKSIIEATSAVLARHLTVKIITG